MNITRVQFTATLSEWYAMYGSWNPNLRKLTADLEGSIPSKVNNLGYLDISDLVAIADWGGNQHDIKFKVQAQNTNEHVQNMTKQAIHYLNKGNWGDALQELRKIHSWGFTYSTKTLRFICPQNYPALDSEIRSHIKVLTLKRNNASYMQFIELCEQIRKGSSRPGPRSGGLWWLADVDMALFAFTLDGNYLI